MKTCTRDRKSARVLLLLLSCVVCVSCASGARLSQEDRVAVKLAFEGEPSRLAASLHVFDVFSDPMRFFVSPYPPDSVEPIRTPSGQTLLPGASIGILPLGTRVRIQEIAFPETFMAPMQANEMPRNVIRITFTCLDERDPRRFVAVLASPISSRSELESQLSHLFTDSDSTRILARYGEEEREALREKRLCSRMSPSAVALSWGPPKSIRIEWQKGLKVETWHWPLGNRSAVFREGFLVESSPLDETSGGRLAEF